MPKGILVSGPAGGGKTAHARKILREAEEDGELMVQSDFQSLVVALTGVQRDPETGRYPLRNPELLPLVEAVRQTVITFAGERGIGVVVTNSDGSLTRREYLIQRLQQAFPEGSPIHEAIVDPGEAIVKDRLSEEIIRMGPEGVPVTDKYLSPECDQATGRWFKRFEPHGKPWWLSRRRR